jgi:hypothetical protein
MKYSNNSSIVLGLAMLLATGCSEDFLDRNHPGDLTYDKLYDTTEDFKAALAGCYQSIMDPATDNIYLGDIPSDNVYISRFQPSGPLPEIDQLVVNGQNGTLSNYWSNNYRTVQWVNLLIEEINNADIEENLRRTIVAEARFLRAYSYFNLVRVFGGVPLYDSPVGLSEIYEVPRSTEEEVLGLVISDLNEAMNIDSYRTTEQLGKAGGKASSVAAKTLLGKVYIWKHDFANAETTLGDIVSGSGLELEDFSVLYDPDNPFNKEIIFGINYERASGFSSPFVTTTIPYNIPPGIYPNVPERTGSGYGMIEPYVAAKFSPEDKRFTELIGEATFENLGILETHIYSRKYVDPQTTLNFWSGSNTIILRYADVLLMFAEALNENGKTAQAYQYINRVRNRAGIDELPEGFSKDQMFQALADERQKEFLMEGDRWFDLRFRGMDYLGQEMNEYKPNAYLDRNKNIQVGAHHILFPIPEEQIQVKPVLQQNPGY